MAEKKNKKEGTQVPVSRVQRDDDHVVSLRDAMNRLFDESFLPFGEFPSTVSRTSMYPHVDVSEDTTKITVTANVPGMEADAIDIEVDDDYLTLSGEVEKEHKEGEEGEKFYRYEREYGSFQRTIPLPARVKPDQVKAKTKNGVLTIELPKEKEERAKKVKVKAE